MLSVAGYWALCLHSQHNAGDKGTACAPRSPRATGRQRRAIGVTDGTAEVRVAGAGVQRAGCSRGTAGGGEGRAEEAVPAEYKPALFPGGESDWINRAVPSAESLSLAGSPTGTLTGSWLHLVSGDVFLLPLLASPLPDSPGLRWAVHGCMEKWGPGVGGRVFTVGGGVCVTMLSLLLARQDGLTSHAKYGTGIAGWVTLGG